MAKCIHFFSDDKYFIEYGVSESGTWFKRVLMYNTFLMRKQWSSWTCCGKANQISHSTVKYFDKEGDERVARNIIVKFDNQEILIPYNSRPSKFKNRLRLPF